jgi:hypothetical protein
MPFLPCSTLGINRNFPAARPQTSPLNQSYEPDASAFRLIDQPPGACPRF